MVFAFPNLFILLCPTWCDTSLVFGISKKNWSFSRSDFWGRIIYPAPGNFGVQTLSFCFPTTFYNPSQESSHASYRWFANIRSPARIFLRPWRCGNEVVIWISLYIHVNMHLLDSSPCLSSQFNKNSSHDIVTAYKLSCYSWSLGYFIGF